MPNIRFCSEEKKNSNQKNQCYIKQTIIKGKKIEEKQ